MDSQDTTIGCMVVQFVWIGCSLPPMGVTHLAAHCGLHVSRHHHFLVSGKSLSAEGSHQMSRAGSTCCILSPLDKIPCQEWQYAGSSIRRHLILGHAALGKMPPTILYPRTFVGCTALNQSLCVCQHTASKFVLRAGGSRRMAVAATTLVILAKQLLSSQAYELPSDNDVNF